MKLFYSLLLLISGFFCSAQPITGVWRGKIINGRGMFANTGKVELKLIKKGDSLLGTCYYFNNANTYMRYSVRGYFDSVNNTVHWTDDKFLAVKPVGKTPVGVFSDPMVSEADFNCPGNNVMKLDGKSQIGKDGPEFTLHFDKVEKPLFHDEWDNVIEGYFTGMADPSIIDSVYAIAKPYEPVVPDDVAKKVNPVVPGQQTVPANATVVPAATTQKINTPGSSTTAVTGETVIPGTAATAGIVTISQPNKTNGGAVNETAQANKMPLTGVPADSSGPMLAKSNPVNPVIAGETGTLKTSPGSPNTPDAGKVVVTSAVVANPPAAKGANPVAENGKPPVTGIADSKSSPKTGAESKTSLPPNSTSAGAGKAVITTNAVIKPLAGEGTNPSTATSKPPAPGENAINTPTAGTVAKQTPPSNTYAGAGKTVQPSATSTGTVSSPVTNSAKPPEAAVPGIKSNLPVVATATPAIIKSDPLAEQMYVKRKKINQAEILVVGDSIELNFYDNAEIDGDSISLFLNGRLLFNHVLLSAQAYTFKIPASDLPEGSELTMVAENLGTIPPNTAYMMAIVNGERYSARIESTEQTSGVIKLVKRKQ